MSTKTNTFYLAIKSPHKRQKFFLTMIAEIYQHACKAKLTTKALMFLVQLEMPPISPRVILIMCCQGVKQSKDKSFDWRLFTRALPA
jgi:hypothetical protein